MAAMVGPAFYAGFRDIGVLPDAARRAVIATLGRASRRVARRAAGDLGFYEQTFLTMQKKIFEDQATMHEAYLSGGVREIENFYGARIIDLATLVAWKQIDRGRGGDEAWVDSGNRTLLWREQLDIIDRFYIRMLGHRAPEGLLFTYLLTLAGAPSVPGAHSYPDMYPLTVSARLPRAVIRLSTPLAAGNIARFADRWRLIESDTLPDYLAFVRDHRMQARALVATPISQRVARYRLLARAGRLAAAAVTHWDLDLIEGSGAGGARPARTVGAHTIDLTTPPTRESMKLSPGSTSQVLIATPSEVTVSLPEGRAYVARAEVAVALAFTVGGPPDRLAARLPAGTLQETRTALDEYARAWGFPSDAVAEWSRGAERRAGSDRAYSTHVFTAADVGFVHLEFQVSHHVGDHEFAIVALFSWQASTP